MFWSAEQVQELKGTSIFGPSSLRLGLSPSHRAARFLITCSLIVRRQDWCDRRREGVQ